MRKEIDEKIKQIVEKIAQEYKPEKIILFGSHAWGEPGVLSDVDLMVVKNDERSRLTRQRDVRGRLKGMGMEIDVLVYTQQAVEKYFKGFLAHHEKHSRKMHDLHTLWEVVNESDHSLTDIKEEVSLLSQFYIGSRYPDDYIEFTQEEAKQSLVAAEKIRKIGVDSLGIKNGQHGFGVMGVVLTLAVLLLLSGGLWFYLNSQNTVNNTNDGSLAGSDPAKGNTSDWQTYRNEEYGFEFKYPEDFRVEELKSYGPYDIATYEPLAVSLRIRPPFLSHGELYVQVWTEPMQSADFVCAADTANVGVGEYRAQITRCGDAGHSSATYELQIADREYLRFSTSSAPPLPNTEAIPALIQKGILSSLLLI